MASKHKLLLITTGGTIAGQVAVDEEIQEGRIVKGADEFLRIIGPTISSLNELHDIDIDIETHVLCNKDSSNILPEQWVDLASLIKLRYDEFDSFLITHGTNTLGYTSAALSFALANPSKPIILTGSQVPAGLPGSDALTNLENALRVAVWRRDSKNQIKGVMVVFGSHIITGTRVKKDTEFDYDAFKSFSTGSLGRIGRIINMNETNLEKHNGYLSTGLYPEARKAKDLLCENEFDMRIASITEFPGMSPDIFKVLADKQEVKGIILRAFGAGDPSERHRDAFEWLKKQKIPLVITTQAPNGNSNLQVNEPGQYLKQHELGIPAYDMSIESQTTKLAWLLAKMRKGDIDYKQVCQEMQHNIRGELSVMWEMGQ